MAENLDTTPEFIGVLFPGIVKNDEKALQCLGGIRSISQIYSQANKKLGLSYQPDNQFVKKIYGDMRKTSGVLLKVRVKKTKSENKVTKTIVSTSVVCRVNKIYKFESLCDFQYLPIQMDETGTNQCVSEQILPADLKDLNFMTEPAPTYIVPSNFTRADKPYNYAYTDKRGIEKVEEPENDRDLQMQRKSRSLPIFHYTFGLSNELPTEPQEFSLRRKTQRLTQYPQLEQEFEAVRKMFDERPISSYKLIKYHTNIKLSGLKIILPCLAIYMIDGPWKKLWIKYGYDPRKNPDARKYQTLDVRVRHSGGMNSMVMTREQQNQSRKSRNWTYDNNIGEDVEESAVYFRPGIAPAQRQLYYQYCDVQLPEVQEILAKDPPSGYLCHLTYGWLPPKTDQFCRDYIFKYMKDAIFSSTNTDLKIEQGGSSDDEIGSNWDEGDFNDTASTVTTGDDTMQ